MKYTEGIIATTHRDLHGDKFTRGALERMVDQLNTEYLPFGIEHDPRIPPQGRIVSAELVELEDGEYGVQAQMELFETDDPVEFKADGRTIPIHEIEEGDIAIIYDRSYRSREDQQDINEISSTWQIEAREYAKKAEEPLSVLIIAAGGAAMGSFFTGLIEKVGADLWDFLKGKVKDLLSRKRESKIEHLLVFQVNSEVDSKLISVEVVLDEPGDDDIDDFLEDGLKLLDKFLPQALKTNIYIRKVIIEYSKSRFRIIYGVRSDGVPLSFSFDDD